MSNEFESRLSSHDSSNIYFRERDVATDVLGEMSFAETTYYMWTGEDPTDAERRLLEAMLSTTMVHGLTPSSIISRLTLMTEPNAVQASVASAVGGVGSRYIGTMKECSEELHALSGADDPDAAVRELVDRYVEQGERFPGIGHPHLDPVDPRAERLFELADEEGIAGEHVDLLADLQAAFERELETDLPINATGAMASISADMGLPPTAARGISIVSRATGVIAEILEEQQNPIGPDIWQTVDQHSTPPADDT